MANTIQASHILLMYEGSARSSATRSRDEAAAKIADLARQIREGARFSDLAREWSDCPSGRTGGDLGRFGRGAMVPRFEEAAFSLEVGEVSDVVETPFGYHLILRTA